MRKLCFLLFFLPVLTFAQNVFHEDFSDNSKAWGLPNDGINATDIHNGELEWKRQGEKSNVITQYMNRLDEERDFTIEMHVKLRGVGAEHGLVWGATDKGNAYYFLVKGKKFRTLTAEGGKIVSSTDYKLNMAVSVSENTFKVTKKGNKIIYSLNDKEVTSFPAGQLYGKAAGPTLWGKGKIAVDEIKATGTALPINVVDDLHYPEAPENMGPSINSKYDEMSPVISPNGKLLYFSRKHHPDNQGGPTDYEDVYYSRYENGEWQPAKNMGTPINNHGPNAVHSVSPDGNTLLLMNTYDNEGKPRGQGLSISHRTKGGWEMPETMKVRQYYNKSPFNEFFLSNNERVLLLALQRDDSYGGRDLYVSFYEGDGIWTEPKNMGMTLNTSGTELSPFLASDGVTLYFSSNGHPGYGQNDVFMTRRQDESWTRWSEPENIGKPINGEGIDSYYSVPASGEFAYFVSSEQKDASTDIYKVRLPSKVKPKPVVIIHGVVRNSKTNEPIGTSITYKDFETDQEMGVARSDPNTGEYEIVLPLKKKYSFFAEKKGFYSVSDNLDLTDAEEYEEIEKDLYLTPIEVGETAQLKNVLFKRSTAILLPQSFSELKRLYDMLEENSSLHIELSGHTDNTGDADLNLELSRDRAKSVKDYLVEKGIDGDRIDHKGYGGERPIADNSKEATRRLNRRVEFKITSY